MLQTNSLVLWMLWLVLLLVPWLMLKPWLMRRIIHIHIASGIRQIDFAVALVIVKCWYDAVETIRWRCHFVRFQRRVSHFVNDWNLRGMLRRNYDWVLAWAGPGVGKCDRVVRRLDWLWVIGLRFIVVFVWPTTLNVIHYRVSLSSSVTFAQFFSWSVRPIWWFLIRPYRSLEK